METSTVTDIRAQTVFSQDEDFTFATCVPILSTLGEVNTQPVRSGQRGDVLQVGRSEHSNDAVSAATEDMVIGDHQATRRRCLRIIDLDINQITRSSYFLKRKLQHTVAHCIDQNMQLITVHLYTAFLKENIRILKRYIRIVCSVLFTKVCL